ncbi:uncharacterized protein LOC105185314 [Harpegnathos saltator]|uniref:Uncharacterized protein n=1 Tax=Harpegnathos saltator TaxID=610380 RepID=E2B4M9_HARSA|nr:uncharacterized protein LOC105185314 [Harpegnathos saltator]EFN89382.1 hypothetical protein EAI_00313 [Harpegnathos saltator]
MARPPSTQHQINDSNSMQAAATRLNVATHTFPNSSQNAVTCDQPESDNGVTNNGTKLTLNKNDEQANNQTDAGIFNLEEYIKKLKQERKDWQQEYKNRKIQRKNLAKEKTIMESQGQLLDINILTESERAFITARPDYEYICKNGQKLSDVALKISILSRLVHKLNQRFMENMENNMSRAVKDIIKMSED